MERSQQQVTKPRGWALKGHLEGAALALMPWRLAMKLVGDGTAPFQEKFLHLEQHAEGPEKEFFAYVYSHEKAIEAFARKERGNDGGSLDAVEGLLTRS